MEKMKPKPAAGSEKKAAKTSPRATEGAPPVSPKEVVRVEVKQIKTHESLQPRSLILLKARERVRQEEQSETHIQDMAQYLKLSSKVDLVPLWLADVDGTLVVVDGHHRLAAYRKAKRETLPARVEKMTLRQASHASKLANIRYTKLEMRPAQKRNALWHHLADITHNGTLQLPQGVSQRSLQGQFGVSLDTVQRMLRRLPEVDPGQFPEEHCDGITGFPHWRFVCHTIRNDMYQQMGEKQRLNWLAEKYTKRLIKLWEGTLPEAVEVAHRKLRAEAEERDDEDDKKLAQEVDEAYLNTMDEGGTFSW